jgi:Cof subfamily protein (haloacid dehalogenase superfamily)
VATIGLVLFPYSAPSAFSAVNFFPSAFLRTSVSPWWMFVRLQIRTSRFASGASDSDDVKGPHTSMALPPTNQTTRIRLVVADIDGTLVTKDKLLTPRSVQAVRKLDEAGILFGVTTGRPPAGARMLIDPLPALKFIAGFNGGIVVRRDFSIFKQNLLATAMAKLVVQIIREHQMDAWLYTDKDWFVRDPRAYRVDREEKTVQFPPKVIPSFDGLYDRVAKIVGVSENYDLVAHCEKNVQERCGASVSAARSQPYYLDVTHPSANKGDVVLTCSEFAGIPAKEIATIGDMANDITMFKQSGLSIAMGNASPEVQKAATYVTASNEEEGFAAAVDDFILPRDEASAA